MGHQKSFRFWLTERWNDHPLVRIQTATEHVLCSLQPADRGDRHWLKAEYGECPDAITERVADAAAEALEGNPYHVPQFCGYDESEDDAITELDFTESPTVVAAYEPIGREAEQQRAISAQEAA